MKTAAQMQQIITRIASQHGVNLNETGAHIRLEQECFMPLVIENIGPNHVSVAHYFVSEGDMITDPEVVFFTGYERWVPVSIQHSFGGVQIVAEADEEARAITQMAPKAQADVAAFCRMWARNIQTQSWLDHGNRADNDSMWGVTLPMKKGGASQGGSLLFPAK